MENFNARLVSRFILIRYLLAPVVLALSFSASAENQDQSAVDGRWESSAGRILEHEGNPRYFFQVKESAEIDIRLENKTGCGADPLLMLLNGSGDFISSNDDWNHYEPNVPVTDCSLNSRIIKYLSKGSYILVAGTFESGLSGDFVVSIRGPENSISELQASQEDEKQSCAGSWNGSGGMDIKSEKNPKFKLHVKERAQVKIDLTSLEDTYLFSYSEGFEYPSIENPIRDDDGGHGYNSRIERELDIGSYRIVAATFGSDIQADFDVKVMSPEGAVKLICGKQQAQDDFTAGVDHNIEYKPNGSYIQQATGGKGNGKVTYSSSNPKFIVDDSGKVTYQNTGKTTITATIAGDDDYLEGIDEYQLIVEPANQEKFELGGNRNVMYGHNGHLTVKALGGSGDGKVSYSSSDPSIATVDENGKISFQKPGVVTITATKAASQNYRLAQDSFKLRILKIFEFVSFGFADDIKVTNDRWYYTLKIHKRRGNPNRQVKYFIEEKEPSTQFSIISTTGKVSFNGSTGKIKVCAEAIDTDIYVPSTACYFLTVEKSHRQNFKFEKNHELIWKKGDSPITNRVNLTGVDYSVDRQDLATVDSNGRVIITDPEKAKDQVIRVTAQKQEDRNYKMSTASYNIRVLDIDTLDLIYAKGEEAAYTKTDYTITRYTYDKPFTINKVFKDIDKQFRNNRAKPVYELKQGDGIRLDENGRVEIKSFGTSIVAISDSRGVKSPVTIKVNILNPSHKFEFIDGDKVNISDNTYNIKWNPGSYVNEKISLYYSLRKIDNHSGGIDRAEYIGSLRSIKGAEKINASVRNFSWDTSKLPEGEYYIVVKFEKYDGGVVWVRDSKNNSWSKGILDNRGVIAERPNKLIVEHDHGFAKDCSKIYNNPFVLNKEKRSSVDSDSCSIMMEAFAYIHPEDGRIVTWNNDTPYTVGANILKEGNHGFKKIYQYSEGFVAFKAENGHSQIKFWDAGLYGGIEGSYNVPGEVEDIEAISYNSRASALGLMVKMKDGTSHALGTCKGPIKCKVQNLDNPVFGVDAGRPIDKSEDHFDYTFGLGEYRNSKGDRIPLYHKHIEDGGYTKRYKDRYINIAVKDNGDAHFWSNDDRSIEVDEGFSELGPEVKIFNNQRSGMVALKDHQDLQHIYPSDKHFVGHRETFALVYADRRFEKALQGSAVDITKIYSNSSAYAALRVDGSIVTFGNKMCGAGSDSPKYTETGFVAIYSNHCGFVAVKANGEMTYWGDFERDTFYDAFREYRKNGGEAESFDVGRLAMHRQSSAPEELAFVDDPVDEKYRVLNPVPVELLSDRDVKVDWTDFQNTIKNIYHRGNILYSTTSFSDLEPDKFAVNIEDSRSFTPDDSYLLISGLDINKTYYLTMVLYDESGKTVAYSRESKISVPILIFSGDKKADQNYEISWNSQSLDNNKISLFYDHNKHQGGGIKITDADNLEAKSGTFNWNTVNLPEGNYYIYAQLDDADQTKYYSQNPVVIDHQHNISDCSSWYNTPGGKHSSNIGHCKRVIRLSDTGEVSFIDTSGISFSKGGNKSIFQSYLYFSAVSDKFVTWGAYTSEEEHQTQYGSFESITSNLAAFAGLDENGAISVWGDPSTGGSPAAAPNDDGYKTIASSSLAFAALKDDKITSWGYNSEEKTFTGKFTKIFSNLAAFAALDDNGKITTWGNQFIGGSGGPTDGGYITITSSDYSFTAIKADGSTAFWGLNYDPLGKTFRPLEKIKNNVKIFTTERAFAALSDEGQISIWGGSDSGGAWSIKNREDILGFHSKPSSKKGYQSIVATSSAFSALHDDGSILSWGKCYDPNFKYSRIDCDGLAPTQGVFTKIYSNPTAFAALDKDGFIKTWGDDRCGTLHSPTDGGYVSIYSGDCYFVAYRANGQFSIWGDGK